MKNYLTLAHIIADQKQIANPDRQCNGEHPKNGCVWEECLEIASIAYDYFKEYLPKETPNAR